MITCTERIRRSVNLGLKIEDLLGFDRAPTGLAVGLAATAKRCGEATLLQRSLRSRLGAPGGRFAPCRVRYSHPAVGPPLIPAPGRDDSAGRFGSRRGSQRLERICVSIVTPRCRAQNHRRAQSRPPDRARQLVPAPRARRRAHARRRLHGVRGRGPRPTTSWWSRSSGRLHLVPRYRQRLAFVPFNQGRPVWVDDPHFNIAFHVRHTALPQPRGRRRSSSAWPGGCSPRRWTASRPLWEIWLVEGLADDRFALLSKTHHALVDGVSGRRHRHRAVRHLAGPDAGGAARSRVGPAAAAQRRPAARRRAARARHRPGRDRRAGSGPRCAARGMWPARRAGARRGRRDGPGGAAGGAAAARSTCASAPTGASPGCAGTWHEFKAIKNALGGTVNDVVLAVVAGALGRYLRLHGEATDDSRAAGDGAGLGPRRRRARRAGQPGGRDVGAAAGRGHRPRRSACSTISRGRWTGIKESGQAVGAQVLTELSGLRAADDHGPGGAAAGPPAAVQPRRHQRARAADAALHARPRARGDVPDGPAGREHRRWGSRS